MLTAEQMQAMRSHVEACRPLEGCGLLAGTQDVVEQVIPIANQANSPTRYRMDPLQQLRAFESIEAQGLELLGIYHSHPTGPDRPSATDIAEASYRAVYVVWSRSGRRWRAKGFWIQDGGVSDVQLQSATGG